MSVLALDASQSVLFSTQNLDWFKTTLGRQWVLLPAWFLFRMVEGADRQIEAERDRDRNREGETERETERERERQRERERVCLQFAVALQRKWCDAAENKVLHWMCISLYICIYIYGNLVFVFILTPAVSMLYGNNWVHYDQEFTFFGFPLHTLLSLCRRIRKHWIHKMLVKHIFRVYSNIRCNNHLYTTYGAICCQLTY